MDKPEQQVKTGDRYIRLFGLTVIVLTFGVFGSWAFLAPLDSAALAQGVVKVAGNRKTIQHLEGGIITDLYVRDGDRVKPGDPLIQLDATQFQSELQVLKTQLVIYLANESRLRAERDDTDSIRFSSELDDTDARVIDAKQAEVQQFESRRAARLGEIDVFSQRIRQLEAQVDGLKGLIASKQARIASYNDEIDDYRSLQSQGYVDARRIRELRRLKEEIAGEVAEHQAGVAGVKVQIGEARLQILQSSKEFNKEVVNQLADIQAKIFDIRERVVAVEDQVRRTLMIAPVEGIVLGLAFHTIGGVVPPSSPVLDIVPETSELIVEAQVSPIDIDRVSVGMKSDIRFSSFKSTITPVLTGEVINVSADSLSVEGEAAYYRAQVAIKDSLEKLPANTRLVPGMPAEVLINTGSGTLFDYLMQPATDAIARSFIED
ncbi:HlyD family type I secretion periplasmic adaptor subunit [Aliamphritea spongicola]|uniref:HlyD family type I secretion periplasmic adaptor subunit n=1 Tax=Aliamphritea spongicola TaxID=707589 RepID=UPI00196B6212|nr:HlyD family type I secretion periplasmic adaptor subunit [Aliamphritea spongicola]MBN3560903.1 HlyD family type I secretion periplasmic adaptor subunit [Aliamphritea spongicola]